MTPKRWPAMGCGVGLRSKHYSILTSERPPMDWFEAVTENYMDTGGRPLRVLEEVRARYPVALHGVSLSIGTTDPLNEDYLRKLAVLAERIEPFAVSDHLCWTGVDGSQLHDLLPLPFTEEALAHVARRVQKVQDRLKRPILLENISTYVTYRHSAVPEWEFLREVARRSGCGILLDLNNVYVNSVNHRFDPERYLEEIPGKWVGQFHLAGHTDKGPFLFDTHSSAVTEKVWALYRKALELYGPVSTLVEWDEEIPDFQRLTEEVQKAKVFYNRTPLDGEGLTDHSYSLTPPHLRGSGGPPLRDVQRQMKDRILSHNHAAFATPLLNPQGGASGEERMAVYAEGYVARVAEALSEVYETLRHLLGREAFVELTEGYLEAHASRSYNLNFIGKALPDFIGKTRFAEKLPFLADLAGLEWQVAQAFHAFEAAAFDPSALSSYSEEDWEKLRIIFQPSVAVVSSEWPILDIWNARKKPLGELEVDLTGRPQNVLVSRRGLEVICGLITADQAELIRSLQSGESLGTICAHLVGNGHARSLRGGEETLIGEWFSSWASRGLISKVLSGKEHEPR